ncbi:MAG TPA: hypothetical protein VGO40_07395 [Longimicrobium sp.]|jgi:hypothetical protein|nr:hypothetical protein [Longimicrobium sp.]
MRATLLTLAALAALLAGCRQKQANAAIPRQRFVLANVDIRSVPDTAPKGDSLRKAALKKHRVTEADLRRFVDVHGRSPEYLADVWREVSDSVQKRYERSFPSRPDGPPPGVGIPGTNTQPVLPAGPPRNLPPVARGGDAKTPTPPPDQPPPPVTEPPRPMVRGQLPPPPLRKPPVDRPADVRHPMTRPGQRPLAPIDSLERRR